MTPIIEGNIRKESVYQTACLMATAARTAPKARGFDSLVIMIAEKDDIEKIASRMIEIAGMEKTLAFFERDAKNILTCDYVLLIGTKIKSLGLEGCNYCGFQNCEEKDKHPEIPCAFNTNDLGIAIGSAVSLAADNRVDNRVMYSVGKAAIDLGIMGSDIKIAFGIALNVASKNIFFDRK